MLLSNLHVQASKYIELSEGNTDILVACDCIINSSIPSTVSGGYTGVDDTYVTCISAAEEVVDMRGGWADPDLFL